MSNHVAISDVFKFQAYVFFFRRRVNILGYPDTLTMPVVRNLTRALGYLPLPLPGDLKNMVSLVDSFKFYLEKIDYGIRIKKKHYNTYFFCQKVDICVTDKNDNIIKLYQNVRSEKIKFFFKAKYIYYLPLGTVKYLQLNTKIDLKK